MIGRERMVAALRELLAAFTPDDILIFGSQSITLTLPPNQIPRDATMSNEIDVTLVRGEDLELRRGVDFKFGELSPFHQKHGYHIQTVRRAELTLPRGWRRRLNEIDFGDVPVKVFTLNIEDMCLSMLAAGREKDGRYVSALVSAGLADLSVMKERSGLLESDTVTVDRMMEALAR